MDDFKFSPYRHELLEKIRSFMVGRDGYEALDERGRAIRLSHDRGYIVAQQVDEPDNLIETLPEPRLEALARAASSAAPPRDAPDQTEPVVDVVGVGEVTGIALGNSAVDKPGFKGARCVGQVEVGKGDGPGNPYLDPARNPFIKTPGSQPAKKDDEPDNPYLDPARNPMIKRSGS